MWEAIKANRRRSVLLITVMGILLCLLGANIGAFFGAMAVCIMFGLSFACVLTMLVMPVAHRLVGALILATTVLIAVRASGSPREAQVAPLGPRLAAGVRS